MNPVKEQFQNGPPGWRHFQRNPDKSSWRVRRAFMFLVAGFCMYVIIYILREKLNTAPADTAMMMSFITLISIVGYYVAGATWEDVNIAKLMTSMPQRGGGLGGSYGYGGGYSPYGYGSPPSGPLEPIDGPSYGPGPKDGAPPADK